MKTIDRLTDFLYNLAYRIKDKGLDSKRHTIYKICTKLFNFFYNLASNVNKVSKYGVKGFILCKVYEFLKALDPNEGYSGETAPYCGHGYYGFDNKYITEHFDEIGGGGETKFSILGYKIYYHSEEGYFISK